MFDGQGGYAWADFEQFLAVYDAVASVVRSAEDYRQVTSAYLISIALQGAVYAELTIAPTMAARVGVDWDAHLEGIAAGIADARDASGIEARLVLTALRHEGPGVAMDMLRRLEREPHPLVTGFGMAGDESSHALADYHPVYAQAAELGLGTTVHAGEARGAESVREALELPISRIGHGVRAVEDPALVEELCAREIVLEVNPTSNVALGVFPTYADHPLRRLYTSNVRVVLGSDDPPHFGTTLAGEYRVAYDEFGFRVDELHGITRTAIEAAFVDDETRAALLAKVG
jgi:adenosine deaminase